MNVTEYGVIPNSGAPCDAALADLIALALPSRVFYFPAGDYVFLQPVQLPLGALVVGDGFSKYYTAAGTRLLFAGPGNGLVFGNGTNSSSGGGVRDLEVLGILDTGASDPAINRAGIVVYGSVGVSIRDVRLGGFKYQIELDAAESCSVRDVSFSGGQDGRGYQDMMTDLGDESACAIRIGSFSSPVPVSANAISVRDCHFNNSRVGIHHKSGIGHSVSDCAYQIPTWAWLQSPTSVTYANCTGEGQHTAALLLRSTGNEGASATMALTAIGCTPSPRHPFVAPDSAKPCGVVSLTLGGNNFEGMGGYNVSPVVSGGQIRQILDMGNRLPVGGASDGALCDSFTSSQGPNVQGTSVNHSTKARAALDVNLYDYTVPLRRFGSEGHVYEQGNAPSSYNGRSASQFRQVYSSNTSLPGAHIADAVGWADVVVSPVVTASVDVPRDGWGTVDMVAKAIGTPAVREARDYVCINGVVTFEGDDPTAEAVLVASGRTISAMASGAGQWAITVRVLHGGT